MFPVAQLLALVCTVSVSVELAAHGARAEDGMAELLYKVPHSDLAEMLGVRRETVTRAMIELMNCLFAFLAT